MTTTLIEIPWCYTKKNKILWMWHNTVIVGKNLEDYTKFCNFWSIKDFERSSKILGELETCPEPWLITVFSDFFLINSGLLTFCFWATKTWSILVKIQISRFQLLRPPSAKLLDYFLSPTDEQQNSQWASVQQASCRLSQQLRLKYQEFLQKFTTAW